MLTINLTVVSKVRYFPGNTTRITGEFARHEWFTRCPKIYAECRDEKSLLVRQLKAKSGNHDGLDENNVVFELTYANGTKLCVQFSDWAISLGTEVLQDVRKI